VARASGGVCPVLVGVQVLSFVRASLGFGLPFPVGAFLRFTCLLACFLHDFTPPFFFKSHSFPACHLGCPDPVQSTRYVASVVSPFPIKSLLPAGLISFTRFFLFFFPWLNRHAISGPHLVVPHHFP